VHPPYNVIFMGSSGKVLTLDAAAKITSIVTSRGTLEFADKMDYNRKIKF
jgi:hypothetical protein